MTVKGSDKGVLELIRSRGVNRAIERNLAPFLSVVNGAIYQLRKSHGRIRGEYDSLGTWTNAASGFSASLRPFSWHRASRIGLGTDETERQPARDRDDRFWDG